MPFTVDDDDGDDRQLDAVESANTNVVVILSRAIDEGFINGDDSRAKEDFVFLSGDGEITSIAKGTEYSEIQYQLRRLSSKQLECVTFHDDRESATDYHNDLAHGSNEYSPPSGSVISERLSPAPKGPNPHVQTIQHFMAKNMKKLFGSTSPLSNLLEHVSIMVPRLHQFSIRMNTTRYEVLQLLLRLSDENRDVRWDMMDFVQEGKGDLKVQ